MSDGSRNSTSNERTIFTAIGARDLMRAKPEAKTGFLRRRGKKERLMETMKLNSILHWRQVFVIIADGCLYNYWNERSTGYFKALSLVGYNRIARVNECGTDCFRIETADPTKKNQVYSCINDSERKEWMKLIRLEMAVANNVNGDTGTSRGVSDYEDIELPLYQYASGESSAGFLTGGSEEEEESEDSDDYDEIMDVDTQKVREVRRGLPPLPDEDVPPPAVRAGTLQYSVPTNGSRPGNRSSTLPPPSTSKPDPVARRPPPPPAKPKKEDKPSPNEKGTGYINAPPKQIKPQNAKRTLSENEYLFDDNNREKALALLKGKPQGTYLIRKARQGDYKVLAVLIDASTGETKEYKIFAESTGMTLNHRDYFPSTEALLLSYEKSPLPNHSARLTRPYSASE